MMLIPAMAFAWCVVSLPHPSDRASAARVARAATMGTTPAPAPAPDPTAPGTSPPPEMSDDADENGGEPADPQTARHAPERTQIRGPLPLSVITFAKTLVNLPMGAEQIAEIDGQRYVFVLQRHYHPPGFVGAPSGWHKGVTAFALQ